MATPQAVMETQDKTVLLTRTFHASREKLFQAWTDPEEMKKWFGPEGVSTQDVEMDLRVGGAFRVVMQTPDGDIVTHHGNFKEITAPEKLVYTWILEGEGCEASTAEIGETLVTIEFKESGANTELTLKHEFFKTDKARDGHEMGWSSSFNCLEEIL